MASQKADGLKTTKEIALLFGVSTRWVQQITKEGIIEGTKVKGVTMYDLEETVRAYVNYLSDRAKGRQAEGSLVLKEQKLKAEIALKESQGDLHRLKADIAAGKFIEVDEVKADYIRFFIAFKRFALSLPTRLSGRVSAYIDPVAARALEKELNAEIINALSGFVVAGQVPGKEDLKNGKRSSA